VKGRRAYEAPWISREATHPAVHPCRSLTALAAHPSSLRPELTKKPVEGFSAGLVNDSLFEWAVTIMGPPDTY
jgi:hypothetical protein